LGIRIIIDGVFNHVSSHHFSFQDVLRNGKASKYYDWFYQLPEHPALPRPGEEVDYTCFAYVPNMPKTDTSCPALRAYFCDIGRYWLREYDVDGWRLDVANEVDDGFLRAFRQAVREVKPDALILGEIWENASHWLQGDMMDGAMNYDFRRFCLQFFATGSLSAEAFDVRISYLLMRYRAQMLPALLNLLDGHDVPRFLSLCGGDLNRMALAVVFQMTFIGMPSVFYGDEKGMTGIAEDEYRSPMSWDEASPLETLYRDLIALRRAHPALTRGTFRTLRAAGKLYVFLREEGGERITVALHAGDGSESVEICGEILLQKGFSCGILSSYSYVIARSVADGDHDL
ncbi:MAG: DUF3459 domain-containing protein, partial [Clostridia bacterium]|nr:DUF3459 domain-containing protein [Clostridia bacterium]